MKTAFPREVFGSGFFQFLKNLKNLEKQPWLPGAQGGLGFPGILAPGLQGPQSICAPGPGFWKAPGQPRASLGAARDHPGSSPGPAPSQPRATSDQPGGQPRRQLGRQRRGNPGRQRRGNPGAPAPGQPWGASLGASAGATLGQPWGPQDPWGLLGRSLGTLRGFKKPPWRRGAQEALWALRAGFLGLRGTSPEPREASPNRICAGGGGVYKL